MVPKLSPIIPDWLGWVIFLATLCIVFLVQMKSLINPGEPISKIWGESFPREYESYLLTRDTTFRSKYAGSATIDMLERYPDFCIVWAGYAFAKGYNQGRGHMHVKLLSLKHSTPIGNYGRKEYTVKEV